MEAEVLEVEEEVVEAAESGYIELFEDFYDDREIDVDGREILKVTSSSEHLFVRQDSLTSSDLEMLGLFNPKRCVRLEDEDSTSLESDSSD